MTPTTATPLPIPAVSPEVLTFAEQQGVRSYLPVVLTLARRIFPTAPMGVAVEDDHELSYNRQIVIRVEVAGLDVPQLVDAQRQWSSDIFEHCPATHVSVFSLLMV